MGGRRCWRGGMVMDTADRGRWMIGATAPGVESEDQDIVAQGERERERQHQKIHIIFVCTDVLVCSASPRSTITSITAVPTTPSTPTVRPTRKTRCITTSIPHHSLPFPVRSIKGRRDGSTPRPGGSVSGQIRRPGRGGRGRVDGSSLEDGKR